MANAEKTTTNLWVIDEAGALETDPCIVMMVLFVPNAANDDLIINDAAGNTAIVMKAGAGDASPVLLNFGTYGRRFVSLTVATIDGGTAYLYKKDSRPKFN